MFAFHISVLVGFAWDGRIYWYESMVFVILLFTYFVVMFQNKPIMKLAKKYIEVKWNLCARVIRDIEETEQAASANAAANVNRNSALEKVRLSTASILSDQMAEKPMKVGDLQSKTIQIND